jgi:hypothetical protein
MPRYRNDATACRTIPTNINIAPTTPTDQANRIALLQN